MSDRFDGSLDFRGMAKNPLRRLARDLGVDRRTAVARAKRFIRDLPDDVGSVMVPLPPGVTRDDLALAVAEVEREDAGQRAAAPAPSRPRRKPLSEADFRALRLAEEKRERRRQRNLRRSGT